MLVAVAGEREERQHDLLVAGDRHGYYLLRSAGVSLRG